MILQSIFEWIDYAHVDIYTYKHTGLYMSNKISARIDQGAVREE